MSAAAGPTLPDPPRDPAAIQSVEQSLVLTSFTADDAWEIGTALRTALLAFPAPAVINITLANSNQLLFHTATRSGTSPDSDLWVSRKRAAVLRFGCSSWALQNKWKGDEKAFKEMYVLGDKAGEYAIHGGGWPIQVKGVEGVVGVVVVSGLSQEMDHQVIVEVLGEIVKKQNA